MFLIIFSLLVIRILNEEAKRQTEANVIVSFSKPDPQKITEGIKSKAIANSLVSFGNSLAKT